MTDSTSNKQLKLEAIDLVSKLATSTPNEIDRSRAVKWRQQSVQHEQAWVEAEQAWGLMAELPVEQYSLEQTLLDQPENAAVARIKNSIKPALQFWQSFGAPAGIAVSLLLLGVVLIPMFQTGEEFLTVGSVLEPVKEYSNGRQQQHSITLSDGSTVHLNYESAILVRFDSNQRNIDLVRGEAFFEVAKNPDRPFTVHAGKAAATAVGTAFVVRRHTSGSAQITVTEGLVHVSQAQDQVEDSVTLALDQRIIVTEEKLGQVEAVNASSMAAWHQGVLVFNSTPLSVALAEIDRYTPYAIKTSFGDWTLEPVTGTFFINRMDQELGSLLTSFNLAIIRQDNAVLEVGLPRPQRPKF